MNCVIVSSKYIDSISVLYLSCFICYKLLQLLKYAHIFSVYTKMRLFKSQKTRGDRAKLFINLHSAHPNKKQTNTYPHSCLRPKIYFCKPVLLVCFSWYISGIFHEHFNLDFYRFGFLDITLSIIVLKYTQS